MIARLREDLRIVKMRTRHIGAKLQRQPQLLRKLRAAGRFASTCSPGQRGLMPTWVRLRPMVLLKSYSWPGNIRQLENVLERAVVIAEGTRSPSPNSRPKCSNTPTKNRSRFDEPRSDESTVTRPLSAAPPRTAAAWNGRTRPRHGDAAPRQQSGSRPPPSASPAARLSAG